MFSTDDIISCYPRKQAIEEGFQVCVSDNFPNDTRIYKYPVYFTKAVWGLCQGKGEIVWDICYMSAFKKTDSSIIEYSVIVEGAERKPDFFEDDFPCYRLLAECGAMDFDDPAPAITISFPGEETDSSLPLKNNSFNSFSGDY